eukprot:m.241805 g.241805  ORF g.241805 m.241805 type:complete len:312 (+) comp13922_c0_seq1:976-1911(+)
MSANEQVKKFLSARAGQAAAAPATQPAQAGSSANEQVARYLASKSQANTSAISSAVPKPANAQVAAYVAAHPAGLASLPPPPGPQPVASPANAQVARYLAGERSAPAAAPAPAATTAKSAAAKAALPTRHKPTNTAATVSVPEGPYYAVVVDFIEGPLNTPVKTSATATEVTLTGKGVKLTGLLPVLLHLSAGTPYAPQDVYTRAQATQWALYPHPFSPPSEKQPAVLPQDYLLPAATALLASNFIAGNSLTIADIVLLPDALRVLSAATVQARCNRLSSIVRWADLLQSQPWRPAGALRKQYALNSIYVH